MYIYMHIIQYIGHTKLLLRYISHGSYENELEHTAACVSLTRSLIAIQSKPICGTSFDE